MIPGPSVRTRLFLGLALASSAIGAAGAQPDAAPVTVDAVGAAERARFATLVAGAGRAGNALMLLALEIRAN